MRKLLQIDRKDEGSSFNGIEESICMRSNEQKTKK